MKKLLYLVVSIVIFGLIISGCLFPVVPPLGQDGSIDIVKDGVSYKTNLIAGQHTVAGSITVSNDDENLFITYETVDNWLINETHLYVGTTIPANSAPGKFPYKHKKLGGVTTDTYEIPLDDLGVEPCDKIFIAAHAELIDGTVSETGWAEGIEITLGKNWAMYFEYQIPCDNYSEYEKMAETTDEAIDEFIANCEIYGEEQAKQMIIDSLLEKEGVIDAGIGIENNSIWFQWENGIISTFSEYPELDEQQKVLSRSFDNLGIITDSKGTRNTPENNKAIIFDWENTDANITQNKIIQDELDYGGYEVEYFSKSKSEFTLYELENIHEYGVIYIDSHGGGDYKYGIKILTGEEPSDEVWTYFRNKYDENYASMIGEYTFYENIDGQEVPKETFFCFYPNFISEIDKNEYYPKSLVYFGTCYSLADTSMADAFINRGAYAYCGYTGKSLSDNDVDMSVFHYLLYGGWDLLSAISYSIPTPPLNFYTVHFYPQNRGDLYLVEESFESCILNVPYRSTTIHNGCLCAAGAMVFSYYGIDLSQEYFAEMVIESDSFINELFNADDFGHPLKMVDFAKSFGFSAEFSLLAIDDIKQKLREGVPVIALQYSDTDRDFPEGLHYRVITGFDDELQSFTASCAQKENYPISYTDFLGLNVIPGQLYLCPSIIIESDGIRGWVDVDPKSGEAPHEVSLTGFICGGVIPYIYQWDFDDGNWSQKGIGNQYLNIHHIYEQSDIYSPTLHVEDGNGDKKQFRTAEVTVTDSGPVHNLTKNTYYTTIQAALDDADNDNSIVVSEGTYNENINFNGKNITLLSTNPNDPNVVASTIIDGGGNGSVVTFAGGETRQAVLRGFTVLNGNSGLDHGGGIYAENSSPSIENNIIRNNVTGNWGGGIYVDNSSSVITGNTITANASNFGGGIFVCNGSFPNISSNIITNNTAKNHGGGIYVNYSSPTILDNIINDNVATGRTGYGGGICVWMGSSPTIKGNTLNNNNANIIGGGIFVYSSSNFLPTTNRPTGWGTGRENIPTSDPLVPAEGVEYFVAGNEFLGNEHGNPLVYTEGAHVYFQSSSGIFEVYCSSHACHPGHVHVELRWEEFPNATDYKVLRKAGTAEFIESTGTFEIPQNDGYWFIDWDVVEGGVYQYKVEAYNGINLLQTTEIMTIDTWFPHIIPDYPISDEVVTETDPTFEWHLESPIAFPYGPGDFEFHDGEFRLYEGETDNLDNLIWDVDFDNYEATSIIYTGPSLTEGRQYFWARGIHARNEEGIGCSTHNGSTFYFGFLPFETTYRTETFAPNENALRILWKDCSAATDYQVYKSTDGNYFDQISGDYELHGDWYEFWDYTVNDGETYYYYVVALDGTTKIQTGATMTVDTWLPGIITEYPVEDELVSESNPTFTWSYEANIGFPEGPFDFYQAGMNLYDINSEQTIWEIELNDLNVFSYTYDGPALTPGHYYIWCRYIEGECDDRLMTATAGRGTFCFGYQPPEVESPTVITVKVDNITQTSARLYGNITDTGGENANQRGFAIQDLTEGIVLTPILEDGSFPTGEYNLTATGFTSGHLYRFSAYAKNSHGSDSGDWIEFTTETNLVQAEITNIGSSSGDLIDPFEFDTWYDAIVYFHKSNTGTGSGTIEIKPKSDSGIIYNPTVKYFEYNDGTSSVSRGFDYQFVGSGTTRELTFELYDQTTGIKLDEYTSETLNLMQPDPNLDYIESVPSSTNLQVLHWFNFNSDYVIEAYFDDAHIETWTDYSKFLFETSNENVVYVGTEIGNMMGIGPGTATITITYKQDTSKKAYLTVNVYE